MSMTPDDDVKQDEYVKQEVKAAPAVSIHPRKAEAKLEKNEKLLVGYQAELDALGENPVRKDQLENKIADLEKQIAG